MFGKSRKMEKCLDLLRRMECERIMAEGRYLEGLRRELALWLLGKNPNALADAYQKAKEFDTEMQAATKERRQIERTALSEKFRFFNDFDMISVKHFVPYEGDSELGIVLRYLDITKMLTLLSIEDPEYRITPFSYEDEKVLWRVIQEKRDHDLWQHIGIAMGRFYAFCQKCDDARNQEFHDRDYAVFRLPHVIEVRYGILVKDENRRGVYACFHGDDKDYKSFYEADERFEVKHSLRRARWM